MECYPKIVKADSAIIDLFAMPFHIVLPVPQHNHLDSGLVSHLANPHLTPVLLLNHTELTDHHPHPLHNDLPSSHHSHLVSHLVSRLANPRHNHRLI